MYFDQDDLDAWCGEKKVYKLPDGDGCGNPMYVDPMETKERYESNPGGPPWQVIEKFSPKARPKIVLKLDPKTGQPICDESGCPVQTQSMAPKKKLVPVLDKDGKQLFHKSGQPRQKFVPVLDADGKPVLDKDGDPTFEDEIDPMTRQPVMLPEMEKPVPSHADVERFYAMIRFAFQLQPFSVDHKTGASRGYSRAMLWKLHEDFWGFCDNAKKKPDDGETLPAPTEPESSNSPASEGLPVN
jgi:hypothetical protein